MKQQILNLKKKLLLVELPEDTNPQVKPHKIRNVAYEEDCFGVFSGEKLLFKYPFKIKSIGKLTDITEDQFKEWVEEIAANGWKNYTGKAPDFEFLKDTAKESFFSKLKADQVLFENPVTKPYRENCACFACANNYKGKVKEYNEAQSKIWAIDRAYLFEIIN